MMTQIEEIYGHVFSISNTYFTEVRKDPFNENEKENPVFEITSPSGKILGTVSAFSLEINDEKIRGKAMMFMDFLRNNRQEKKEISLSSAFALALI